VWPPRCSAISDCEAVVREAAGTDPARCGVTQGAEHPAIWQAHVLFPRSAVRHSLRSPGQEAQETSVTAEYFSANAVEQFVLQEG